MKREGLFLLGAIASSLLAAPTPTLFYRITEKTTLGQILGDLTRRTTAQLRMDEATRTFAHRYTFPPHMVGVTVTGRNAGDILAFLFGAGWEGSPLPRELRAQFPNRQLARTPMPVVVNGKKLWTCNNRAFDWKWEKPKGGPSGGIITVWLRVQRDGDLVKRPPIDLRPSKMSSRWTTCATESKPWLAFTSTLTLSGIRMSPTSYCPNTRDRFSLPSRTSRCSCAK